MDLRDPRPGESWYRILTQMLRERICRGDFENGPLPTELSLAEEYGLSRQTVRRAFQELVSEGLVYRVRGSGTFITPQETRYARPFGSVDDLLQLQLDTTFELSMPLTRLSDAAIATRLRQDGSDIWTLTFRRAHNGQAFCRTQVFLPSRIGKALEKATELLNPAVDTQLTVISLIQSRGFDIAEAEQVITAISADKSLAADLGCLVDIPVLHVERTYLDRGGQGLELAISDFLPDHYQHRTRLGRRIMPVDMPETFGSSREPHPPAADLIQPPTDVGVDHHGDRWAWWRKWHAAASPAPRRASGVDSAAVGRHTSWA